MDYSALFTTWSKFYRDLYKKTHDSVVEEWTKAEERMSGASPWAFWKK